MEMGLLLEMGFPVGMGFLMGMGMKNTFPWDYGNDSCGSGNVEKYIGLHVWFKNSHSLSDLSYYSCVLIFRMRHK